MNREELKGYVTADRVLQTVGGIVLAVCVWLAKDSIAADRNHDNRLTTIEASRFTSADALRLTTAITELQSAPPADPPVWLMEQLRTQQTTLDAMDDRLDSIERELTALRSQQHQQRE